MQPDEIKYDMPLNAAAPAARGWRYSLIVKLLIAAVFVFGVAALYPVGGPRSVTAPEGSIWNGDDVVADFSFPIFRADAAYKHDADSAANAVVPVFVFDARADGKSAQAFTTLFDAVRLADESTTPAAHNPEIHAALIAAQSANPSRKETDAILASCKLFLRDAYHRGVIDLAKSELHNAGLVARHDHNETQLNADSIVDNAELVARLKMQLEGGKFSAPLLDLAIAAARTECPPNLLFDSIATMIDRREAAAQIPRSSGIVARGERIIARGETVDAAALERLNAYRAARTVRGEEHVVPRYFSAVLQLVLMMLLVAFYLFTLRRKLLADNQQLLLCTVIMLFEALLAYASMRIGGGLPLEYLIVVPAAAMLGTILFDSRTGFFFAVLAALIAAGIRGGDYAVALAALVAGGLAAYTVRDIRSRTQLFKSIAYIFLGYVIAIVASSLERATPWSRMGLEASFALLNAVISPVLTYALLIVFERVFKLTSDLTLLEFDNINHPLLKELSTSAPGTFHHTMVIADMAERAANAIGANAILAKVGAYYHDIGKISSPEFFVENQLGMRNKHERLAPLSSARIIMQHVPDGLALAEQYHLPQKIKDFIPMHHGTSMIAFFYDRALRRRRREDVRAEDFRYPGPKPHSKETAIVMLADSVEATIRSTEAIDEAAIEKIVDRTIRNRFLEGQLDECELTASDLGALRDQFVEILIGIHHPRIKYPDQPQPQPEAPPHDEAPPGAASEPQDIPPPTDMPVEPNPNEDPI